jgi:broad specificity polyphosphatase/5'/3'-nucleotidase SurE
MRSIDAAVERTVLYAEEIGRTTENVVHNINFPYPMTSQTEKEITRLSNIMHGKGALYPLHGSLYEKEGDEYVFAIEQDLDTSMIPLPGTDIDALMRGKISHTVIDLRRLC